MSEIKEDQVLDVQGEGCPMPILKTKKALDKMNSGEILKILGTDPGTKNDLPAFCKRTGHEFLGAEENNGVSTFYVKRK